MTRYLAALFFRLFNGVGLNKALHIMVVAGKKQLTGVDRIEYCCV